MMMTMMLMTYDDDDGDDDEILSPQVPKEEPEIPNADVVEVDDELLFVDRQDETEYDLDDEIFIFFFNA